jgi:dephospho-CoA kinase
MFTQKIALTGGIASGKSLASKIFQKLGANVIDLDAVSRKVVVPGSDGLMELVKSFGSSILNSDGTLNRKELRKLLIDSKDNQIKIESILHQKILDRMDLEVDKIDSKFVIIEIPLLAESGSSQMYDRAIIVDCEESTQLERLITRENIDKDDAIKMMSAQVNREDRLKISDNLPTDIITNDTTESDLGKQVSALYEKFTNNY